MTRAPRSDTIRHYGRAPEAAPLETLVEQFDGAVYETSRPIGRKPLGQDELSSCGRARVFSADERGNLARSAYYRQGLISRTIGDMRTSPKAAERLAYQIAADCGDARTALQFLYDLDYALGEARTRLSNAYHQRKHGVVL